MLLNADGEVEDDEVCEVADMVLLCVDNEDATVWEVSLLVCRVDVVVDFWLDST